MGENAIEDVEWEEIRDEENKETSKNTITMGRKSPPRRNVENKKNKSDNNVNEIDEDELEEELKSDPNTKENKEEIKDEEDENTKELDPSELSDKSKQKEKIKVTFGDPSSVEDFVKQKTAKSNAKIDKDGEDSRNKILSSTNLKDEIKKVEEKEFTADELRDFAKVMVDILDIIMSMSFRFWAGDTSDKEYSLPKDKKSRLEFQLTLILVKYQQRFKIEYLFVLTLLAMYYVPFTKAREFRKQKKRAKQQGKKHKRRPGRPRQS